MDLAKHATVPVINMLTDFNHPCQVMSDMLTVKEKLGRIDNVRIAYVGDSNNVTNSWLNMAARIPLDLRIATAPETEPDMKLVSQDCYNTQEMKHWYFIVSLQKETRKLPMKSLKVPSQLYLTRQKTGCMLKKLFWFNLINGTDLYDIHYLPIINSYHVKFSKTSSS